MFNNNKFQVIYSFHALNAGTTLLITGFLY